MCCFSVREDNQNLWYINGPLWFFSPHSWFKFELLDWQLLYIKGHFKIRKKNQLHRTGKWWCVRFSWTLSLYVTIVRVNTWFNPTVLVAVLLTNPTKSRMCSSQVSSWPTTRRYFSAIILDSFYSARILFMSFLKLNQAWFQIADVREYPILYPWNGPSQYVFRLRYLLTVCA